MIDTVQEDEIKQLNEPLCPALDMTKTQKIHLSKKQSYQNFLKVTAVSGVTLSRFESATMNPFVHHQLCQVI